MEKDIANFFDIMVKEHINPKMLPYINMAKLRDNFIDRLVQVLQEYHDFHLGNPDLDGEEYTDELNDLIEEKEVPFWFNSYDGYCELFLEAENKITEFSRIMYEKYSP